MYYIFVESKYKLQNDFAQADISSGEPVFIELFRYFRIDGGQHDVVLRLKKSLCGQARSAHLWYEKLKNGLLERSFVVSKVDTSMFMSKIVIYLLYVNDCLFCTRSQSEIDNVIKSSRRMFPVTIGSNQK